MSLFRNFIVLVPDRHLVSPENIQIFFPPLSFSGMQVTTEVLISPCVSDLAPCTIMFHLIFIAPAQVCQLFLYNFVILFHVDIAC